MRKIILGVFYLTLYIIMLVRNYKHKNSDYILGVTMEQWKTIALYTIIFAFIIY